MGIFSGLNNLRDLTMDAQYATMLGYTQEELESNFVEEIEMACRKLNVPSRVVGANAPVVQWLPF
ncbi:MAG: AAA family ATPase [Haliscomenobacter sp.]|nr:AAA family ATPase [Haliscomenobacter sp.]